MKQKWPFAVMGILAALVCAVSVFLYFHRKINLFERDQFGVYFRAAFPLILLGILWLLFLLTFFVRARSNEQPDYARWIRWWQGTVIILFLFLVSSVVWVNPYGRFPNHRFPTITIGTRDFKTRALKSLPVAPQLVVLGSSRAFTISPSYLADRLGISGFNWSVEEGASEDFYTQVRILDAMPWPQKPRVLLVEVKPPLSRGQQQLASDAPLSMLPYMRPSTALVALENAGESLLNISSISDASYLAMMGLAHRQNQELWHFAPDGSGVQDQRGLASDLLEAQIRRGQGLSHCRELDPLGQQNLKDLIRVARTWNAAVILYESPRHARFFDAMQNDRSYQACHQVFVNYMNSLVSANPAVTYLDLSYLPALRPLAADAFYDSQHLTPLGSRYLVDALTPAIRKALEGR